MARSIDFVKIARNLEDKRLIGFARIDEERLAGRLVSSKRGIKPGLAKASPSKRGIKLGLVKASPSKRGVIKGLPPCEAP